jgi:hypothetical protein
VKTKISGDNCPLLVTLRLNTDPYLSLRYMAETLTAGMNSNATSQPNITGSTTFSNNESNDEPLVIDLEQHLANEGRKAGN